MRWKEWGAFWLLGTIWGSSFLWIKIAVADIGPAMLGAIRLALGALGFLVVFVLMSGELGMAHAARSLAGQAAVLLSAISYAVAATFSRRHLRGHPPLLQATMVVLLADALVWLTAAVGERPLRLPALP